MAFGAGIRTTAKGGNLLKSSAILTHGKEEIQRLDMLAEVGTHVINQVLQLVAHWPGQRIEVSAVAIGAILLHTPDDAHEKAILVVDAAEVGFTEPLHRTVSQLI